MGLPLVVSDYRSKKILKRYRVTPVSPVSILFVQAAIYTLYSVVSLLLAVAFCSKRFFDYQFHGSPVHFAGGYLLVIISMFSIGFMVGGIVPNIKIVGVIASILYFPMLIFSGAVLPYEVMPKALQQVVDILPLTQGIKLLKNAPLGLESETVLFPTLMMLLIGAVCIAISLKFLNRNEQTYTYNIQLLFL